MNIAVFSTKVYDHRFLDLANKQLDQPHHLSYFEPRLTPKTAVLAKDAGTVCAFVNDQLNREVLEILHKGGTRLITMRCAGFNNVDLKAAAELGMPVVRVPAYSPHAVAEHALGMILALNRKIHRSYARVREGNFALEGLLGFDLNNRTMGIIGTGRIGRTFAGILCGLGMNLLAYDPYPNKETEELGATYVDLPELFSRSDIVSLHCPLTKDTYHLIDSESLSQMKRGVMLINTSRGALIDTPAAIDALKSGQVGYLGLDVYEEEEEIFFEDLSGQVLQDDVFARLQTLPNVIITGHQAFFTEEAVSNIAETTLGNISAFEAGVELENEIRFRG